MPEPTTQTPDVYADGSHRNIRIIGMEWRESLKMFITPDNPVAHPWLIEDGGLKCDKEMARPKLPGPNGAPRRGRVVSRSVDMSCKARLGFPEGAEQLIWESLFRSPLCNHDGLNLAADDLTVTGAQLVYTGAELRNITEGFILLVASGSTWVIGRVDQAEHTQTQTTLTFDFSDPRIAEQSSGSGLPVALPAPDAAGLTLQGRFIQPGDNNHRLLVMDVHPFDPDNTKHGKGMVAQSVSFNMSKKDIEASVKLVGLDYEIKAPIGTVGPYREPVWFIQGDNTAPTLDGIEVAGNITLTLGNGLEPKDNPNTTGAGFSHGRKKNVEVKLQFDADFMDRQDLLSAFLKATRYDDFFWSYRLDSGYRWYIQLNSMEHSGCDDKPPSGTDIHVHTCEYMGVYDPAKPVLCQMNFIKIPE